MLKEIPGIVRGTAREALATTKIGAWGLLSSTGGHYLGELYDIEINGVRIPINNRNDQIVCPGIEAMPIIYDKSMTPALVGNQWQHLGNGRWQLIGDGSYNSLRLVNSGQHPLGGIVEFEVESITGQMRASSGGIPNSAFGYQFNTPGLKRYFYTAYSSEAIVEFSRNNAGVPASCIIKNITFRPLILAAGPELIVNGTFADGTNTWQTAGSGTIAVSGGQATLTTVAGQSSRFEKSLVLEPNKWYVAVADLISLSGNTNARLNVIRGLPGNYLWVANSTLSAPGRMIVTFRASHSDAILQIVGDGVNAGTVVVDNISLKEVTRIVHPQALMNATSVGWQERPLQNKPAGFFSIRNANFSRPSNTFYLGII